MTTFFTDLYEFLFEVHRQQVRVMHLAWVECVGALAYATFPTYFDDNVRIVPLTELHVGQTARVRAQMDESRFLYFARAVDNWNPAQMRLGGVLPHRKATVHSALLGSAAVSLIESRLLGPGIECLKLTYEFATRPVYIGEWFEMVAQVRAVCVETAEVSLTLEVVLPDGEVVIKGHAHVRQVRS